MEFAINGANLHYEVLGNGEPLLWLHGFTGAGSDWQYLFAEPPAGFQLIAPDLRGHGRSTNPSDTFSFRESAHDVLALLAHLGCARVKAIGLSGGGIALLHMAMMQPDAVAAMVLVSVPLAYPPQARGIQRQFGPEMLSEQEMALMRQRHAGGQEQIDRLFAYARSFADDYEDVNFSAPLLSAVTASTLIVFGDRDPLYPVTLGVELYQAMPTSYLWVVPNGGHGPVFGDHRSQFTTTALAFLRGEWRQSQR